MNETREADRLRELEDEVAAQKEISADTLRRMLARVADYGESHKAMALPDELLRILQDDLASVAESPANTAEK